MSERRLTYSIIIPVYNKWALTAACLDALGRSLAHRRGEGEIIVVDDASTDETASALTARPDVDRVVRHEVNAGFQGAACDGAAAARGETIVFLNNDTAVEDGWLDALLDELRDPSVGIAGAMFLFPDGRVQEFGGVVWRDATAYHIGAGLPPLDALFAEPRDVDYVSGAGMALARSFWNELGGFDPQLAPAYYEDTDLCMKVRAAGKRVVVTPRSRIVHVMGGSKDVDPRKSHDTMMSANREKFRAKWAAVLDREHWPAHPYCVQAASRRSKSPAVCATAAPLKNANAKRLLFVYWVVPQFDRQAGDRRFYEIMRTYRDMGHSVTVLAFDKNAAQAAVLQAQGFEVWHGDSDALLSPRAADDLEDRLRRGAFDLVYFGSPHVARMYLAFVRNVLPEVTVVTDAIDLAFLRMHRDRLINGPATALVNLPIDRDWEIATYAGSDAVVSVSEEEAAILRASGITVPIEIVSTFFNEALEPPGFANRGGVAMVLNMAHHPNIDGLRWFLSDVWPRVLQLNPALTLSIFGNGTDSLRLSGDVRNVAIAGFLPSIDPVFTFARVNVAPLRVGAGVKGKVTEAMRNGLPTVTTPVGAEGLGAGCEEALLIENDPQRFAEAIVRVHGDEALWSRVSGAGRAFARRRFSREAYAPALERIAALRVRTVHVPDPPTAENLAQAFADPLVAAATFAAGEAGPQLAARLRSECAIGAIVGASGEERITAGLRETLPALVVSRAAYSRAVSFGPLRDAAELLPRARACGMLVGSSPHLPHEGAPHREEPFIVDVMVCAASGADRITAIVDGVKRAAHCRLRIIPGGDLSPALPGEITGAGAHDGTADARIFDGTVQQGGMLSALGFKRSVALDQSAALDSRMLGEDVARWKLGRFLATVQMHAKGDVFAAMKVLAKAVADAAARPLLVGSTARHLQAAWAWSIPATNAFRALPEPVSGSGYLFANSVEVMERLLEQGAQSCVTDRRSELAGIYLSAEQTPREISRAALEELCRQFPAQARSQIGFAPKHRIAIGLCEHFGDIVACEPVARYLRERHQGAAHIAWAVRAPYRELIDSNPHIDETLIVDCLTDWIALKRHGAYDEYVDLHVNGRVCPHCSIALEKTAGDPWVTGETYLQYGPLLTAFSLGAGLPALSEAPRVYVNDAARSRVDTLHLPERFVAVHCSSNEASRDWDPQKWAAFAREMQARCGLPIVEIGSRALLAGSPGVRTDLCGAATLLESAEIIRRAELFVGVDSGPAHLANAVGTPGVVLLGEYRGVKRYEKFTGGYGDGTAASIVWNENGPASSIAVEQVVDACIARLGERAGAAADLPEAPPKIIAFYLPQYHPTAENDRWWGAGFTEWRNVARAQPLFPDHYQPHAPAELGYYDLRVPETRSAQAELAREYGIGGFAYYHYWFNGRRLLNRPLDDMLASAEPDMPFCLCWANEDWTRAWDGRSGEVLIGQRYDDEDDLEHIRFLCGVFTDRRYIRIDGKPLFLVYRASLLPDPARTAKIWREYARSSGIGEIYLCCVESFPDDHGLAETIGFDAGLEFQPDWTNLPPPVRTLPGGHRVFDYAAFARHQQDKAPAPYRRFPCVAPKWDNAARRSKDAVIFHGSTPDEYEAWLSAALRRASTLPAQERLVFVNAWNEWGEGCHLEPDMQNGRAYLEASKRALISFKKELAVL